MYIIARARARVRASESSLLVEYNFLRKGEGCLKNALSYLLSVSRHELYETRIPVTCLKLSREIVTQGEASRLSSGDIEIKRERMRFSIPRAHVSPKRIISCFFGCVILFISFNLLR